jgi:Mg/Co/Ni transporter MgtE
MKNKYPLESAGRRMVANVPTARPGERISDVKKMLFEKMEELETINYIYVIDK